MPLSDGLDTRPCKILDPRLFRHGTGSLGHLSRPGHWVIILTRCDTRVFPVFEKKVQDKDIKIYIFVKIRPTVIEIYTTNATAVCNAEFDKY